VASPDTTHFAADVRTFWLHGTWPAGDGGAPSLQDDPVAREVRIFANAPSGYGPVMYAVGGAPISFVGDGIRANVFGQKVLSGALLVVVAALTGLVARRLGYNPGMAVVFVGMNPLFILQFPGDGHNDTVMMAFAMLATLALVALPGWRSKAVTAAAGALAVLSKFSIAVLAPVVLAWWLPDRPEARVAGRTVPAWRAALGVVVAVGGIAALVLLAPNRDADSGTLGPLLGLTDNTPYHLAREVLDLDGEARLRLVLGAYAALFVAAGALVAFHRLETPRDLLAAMALLMAMFVFAASPTLRHWYQIWAFPFIVVGGRRWLTVGAVAFSFAALVQIFARQWSFDWADAGFENVNGWAVAATWVVTSVVAFMAWWYWSGRAAASGSRPPPGAPAR
jgi:hypothetical protein